MEPPPVVEVWGPNAGSAILRPAIVERRMTAEPASGVEQSEQPHTVLVVEDEVLVRLALAEHLRDCGYRVLEAANAFEAIQILTEDIRVDVLLSDVQMPGDMNGFGLAKWTRQHRPTARIVMTSGHEQAAHEASDLCAEEPFIKRPYDPARLAAEIRRLLASRNG
jgi:CheY-like chemotaxis protein